MSEYVFELPVIYKFQYEIDELRKCIDGKQMCGVWPHVFVNKAG